MSDNTFWVNTDGLAPATSGFHEKANQLSELAGQISDLISQIPQAAGGDKLGRDFAEQVTPQIGQLHQGVQSLADALVQAGDGVSTMAKMFEVTNNNASSTSSSLSNLLNSGQPLTPATFTPAEVGVPPSASGPGQPLTPATFTPAEVGVPPSASGSWQPLMPRVLEPRVPGTPPSASGREQPLPAEFWPAQVETPLSGSDSGGGQG
jgi:uncharacterized protein YukE